MSVDNTTSYPTSTTTTGSAGSASSGTLASLSEAFAKAFKTSMAGASSGKSNDTSLLEATQTDPEAMVERRAEANREVRDNSIRQDTVRDDRKTMDRTETRQDEMKNEYADHREARNSMPDTSDRPERVRENAGMRSVDTVRPEAERIVNVSASETVATVTGPNLSLESVMPMTLMPPSPAAVSITASTQTAANAAMNRMSNVMAPNTMPTANVVNPAAVNGTTPIVVTSGPASMSGTGAIPVSLQATTSVFTVFTASGRLGDEKEKNDRHAGETDRKREKRKQGSSFFGEAVTRIFGGGDGATSVQSTRTTKPEQAGGNHTEIEATVRREAEPEDRDEMESSEATRWNREKRSPELAELLQQMQPVKDAPAVSVPETESSAAEQMERVRFVQRIAAACHSAANQTGAVRVKVNLDRHGSVTLRIAARKTEDGRRELSVRFETETASAARLLGENLDELRATLGERNTVLREVEIE